MKNKSRFAIPKPCHEDWELMTPQEQGRHCAKCNLVVRDFTQNTTAEIQKVMDAATGRVCGNIRQDQLTPVQSKAAGFWMKFPVQRMRIFLLAFIAVFGVEFLGSADLHASDLQQLQTELKSPESLATYLSDINEEVVEIKGRVMDAETGEGVPYATVVIYYQEEIVKGIYTDADGVFDLSFSAEEVDYDTFTVVVKTMGNEVRQEGITPDIEEMMIFISSGVTLEPVRILASDYGVVSKGVILRGDMITVACEEYELLNKWYFRQAYNPIDDFIQMRRSDVYYREGDPMR